MDKQALLPVKHELNLQFPMKGNTIFALIKAALVGVNLPLVDVTNNLGFDGELTSMVTLSFKDSQGNLTIAEVHVENDKSYPDVTYSFESEEYEQVFLVRRGAVIDEYAEQIEIIQSFIDFARELQKGINLFFESGVEQTTENPEPDSFVVEG